MSSVNSQTKTQICKQGIKNTRKGNKDIFNTHFVLFI